MSHRRWCTLAVVVVLAATSTSCGSDPPSLVAADTAVAGPTVGAADAAAETASPAEGGEGNARTDATEGDEAAAGDADTTAEGGEAELGPPLTDGETDPDAAGDQTADEVTPSSALSPEAAACLASWSNRLLAAQTLMPLIVPGEYPTVVADAGSHRYGSVALLGTPTADEVRALRSSDTAAGSLPLLIASDEEGGRVQRLSEAAFALPSAQDQGTLGPAELRARVGEYGATIAALGIDMVLAPVVDVGGGPGIGDRAFASDAPAVTSSARAVIRGYADAGVLAVLKHFPGHGGASQDTHFGSAQTAPLDQLRTSDLVPFVELADGANVAVMVGHLLVPGLTEDVPTSLSPAAIDGLLRGELGFDGLVITDALGMDAVANGWDQRDAARLALAAGADVVILADLASAGPVLDSLAAAMRDGSLDRAWVEEAVGRVLRAKGLDACSADPRTAAGEGA